jgi:hypothetical protein
MLAVTVYNKIPHDIMAEGQGLEPRLTESKSAVLPLDDPSTTSAEFYINNLHLDVIIN